MSKKVLVVDDDPDVRLFSVTVLEEHGYTPLEAADGVEGLKMIKAYKKPLLIAFALSIFTFAGTLYFSDSLSGLGIEFTHLRHYN